VLGKERWKRNEDWCGDVLIKIGQEKDEARMKLLNRGPRENRELYKQRKKERKKHTYCIERRRERRLTHKLSTYKVRTVIKNTENSIKMLKN
jgi:hypothetical protein